MIENSLRSWIKSTLMGRPVQVPRNDSNSTNHLLSKMGMTAFINCSLFDGETTHRREGMTVLVDGNKITAVDHNMTDDLPEGCRIIDGSGYTLLPGLIDGHTHLYSPFTYEVNLRALGQLRRQLFLNHINTLYNGITTVCDMGGPPGLVREFKNRVDNHEIPGPDSLNCFTILSPRQNKKIGYPVQVKPLNPVSSWLIEGQVATRPSSLKELHETCCRFRDLGATHLKMTYQAHSFSAKQEVPALPLFDDDWVKVIFKCAREANMGVSIHAPFSDGIGKCVDLAAGTGTRITLQHACCDTELDKDLFIKMKDHGIFMIPTLMVYGDAFLLPERLASLHSVSEKHLTAEASRQLKRKIQGLIDQEPSSGHKVLDLDTVYFRQQFEIVRRNTLLAHAEGVIGLGTDMGGTYTGLFGRFVDEVQHYSDLGIPSCDILRYITADNAKIHNLNDRGVIQPGKRADLILVKGNPLDQLNCLAAVSTVMKDGCLIKLEGKTLPAS